MALTWGDTEISLMQAGTASDIWCGVIPALDIQQIIDCTGRLRAAQAKTIEMAKDAGWGVDFDMDRVHWKRVRNDMFELWARVI